MAQPAGKPQPTQETFLSTGQDPLAPASTIRRHDDDAWCADDVNILPDSHFASPEEMARLHTFPLPLVQTDQARLQPSSAQLAMQMMPVASSNYLSQTGLRCDAAHCDPLPPAAFPGMYASDLATRSSQSTFLPALMLQRQHAQAMTSHCSQSQSVPSRGSAMEQLALSTAATADLLAGMAANSSHAHPGSASDLILAASATLQAFARAAQCTQGPFGSQQALGNAGNMLLANPAAGPTSGSHLPEQQRQQLMFMQQQQQGWFASNYGAPQHR